MYYRAVAPNDLGHLIREVVDELVQTGTQMPPQAALYCEKRQGFQCRSCQYSTPTNATHGRCAILRGPIHLDEGCCCAWSPDTTLLHLYREPLAE